MRILVTGAHGFVGRSLLELDGGIQWAACGRGPDPVGKEDYSQLDLSDARAVSRLVERIAPDWIINTAAVTDVDRCEKDRALAHRINVDGVAHLAAAAARVGSGLVQLSTDYVFDGTSGPYGETDPPHPLSVYGATKLASEKLVLGNLERGIVVRTLWLYGYLPGIRPNFVTRGLDALRRSAAIRVFDDQWGNPTYVGDLAQVLVALCRAGGSGLFHMGGATFMTRYELILELAHAFGLDPTSVEPVPTRSAGLPARRPLRSGLRTEALREHIHVQPLGFADGLTHMRGTQAFRRDFPHLA